VNALRDTLVNEAIRRRRAAGDVATGRGYEEAARRTQMLLAQASYVEALSDDRGSPVRFASTRLVALLEREGYHRPLPQLLARRGELNEAEASQLVERGQGLVAAHSAALSAAGLELRQGSPALSRALDAVLDADRASLAACVALLRYDLRPPLSCQALEAAGLDTRYRLLSQLGQGGMGTVYLAQQITDARLVALKLLSHKARSPEAVERFKREILCNSFLAHPGIVEIYDGGETQDDSYFMAMEYVDGELLQDALHRSDQLSAQVVLEIMKQLCSALEAIHAAGIVHRDLKPENILIAHTTSPSGPSLTVKLMDFGISRILDAEQDFSDQFFQTNAGQLTGSPAYVAPESIVSRDVDPRADLYSLGIIAYELTVGATPFKGESVNQYLQMHLYKKPKPPRQAAPERDTPAPLEALILRLLAKKPRDRFESAKALRGYIEDEVIPRCRELEQPGRKTIPLDPGQIGRLSGEVGPSGDGDPGA
jgi:predicted Ser/Thr protein kinase